MTRDSNKVHLLALETSGSVSGVYLSDGERMLGQITLHQKNIHSRRLSLSIRQLLEHLDLTEQDLSGIILSAGPGSFTGLRIGYSLGKGLAHALKCPIIEVPTLDIWARQIGRTSLPVFSFVNAHRDEIFYAIYRWKSDVLKRETDYQLIAFNNISEVIKEKMIITGAEIETFRDRFTHASQEFTIFAEPLPQVPEGHVLLSLGYQKYVREEYSPLESCEPMYLRAFKGVM
jgi:tRNA threonylcarbamoyladenosine biosynthesis protein TsaB